MSIDQLTKEALDLENLQLPARPEIVGIEYEPYEDSTGEDSLEIWVVLSDSTLDEDITGTNVMQIKSAIRGSLHARGIKLFPYVRLVTESEFPRQAKKG